MEPRTENLIGGLNNSASELDKANQATHADFGSFCDEIRAYRPLPLGDPAADIAYGVIIVHHSIWLDRPLSDPESALAHRLSQWPILADPRHLCSGPSNDANGPTLTGKNLLIGRPRSTAYQTPVAQTQIYPTLAVLVPSLSRLGQPTKPQQT